MIAIFEKPCHSSLRLDCSDDPICPIVVARCGLHGRVGDFTFVTKSIQQILQGITTPASTNRVILDAATFPFFYRPLPQLVPSSSDSGAVVIILDEELRTIGIIVLIWLAQGIPPTSMPAAKAASSGLCRTSNPSSVA